MAKQDKRVSARMDEGLKIRQRRRRQRLETGVEPPIPESMFSTCRFLVFVCLSLTANARHMGAFGRPHLCQYFIPFDSEEDCGIRPNEQLTSAGEIRGGSHTRHPLRRIKRVFANKNETEHHPIQLDLEKERLGSFLRREIQKGTGAALCALGFLYSTTTALVTDRTQFRRWRPTVASIKSYLQTSGIDAELYKAISFRLLENLIILSRIQQASLNGKDRRDQAIVTSVAHHSHDTTPTPEEAARYMRYATASYGKDMIRAAQVHVHGKLDTQLAPLTKAKISKHIRIPEEDIILMDVSHGGQIHHLRHFVAIDHEHQAVVLAIRGSFSVADMIVDAAAFSRPFCGGEAHSEIANQAERVWAVAERAVLDALQANDGYELVITGHSSGAAAACLVNILCHSKQLLPGCKIRCFAFASPPVFTPLKNASNAVRSTTHYVYQQDVVPFLSADSVRRLLASIHEVEAHTRYMGWGSRTKLATGRATPDVSLVEAVMQASAKSPPPRPGAPTLSVPASSTIWIHEDRKKQGQYNVKQCDPLSLSTLGIFVHPNMMIDHFPPRYEHALNSIDF